MLVGEAIEPGPLDRADLEQRLTDAEQRLGEEEEGSAAYESAERDKTRAEAFLEIAG